MKSDMKIAFGIPHYDVFNSVFLKSVLLLFKQTTCAIHLIMEKSPYIHKSRNRAFKEAQNVGADYLVMIDCDMGFPPDALQKLIALDKDVASGLYYEKDNPHYPLAYTWTGDTKNWHGNIVDIPAEPFKIDAVGTGFMLISKKVLDYWTPEVYAKHGKPFSPIWYDDGEGGEIAGEDTSFCLRMRDVGFDIWVDPTFELIHTGIQRAKKAHWEMARSQLIESKGWTTEKELQFLSEMAAKSSNIVEVGCWKGQSTKALLEASDGVVHAIDHFNGSPTDESGGFARVQDVFAQFTANVGHYPNLKIHKMSSEEAVVSFRDNSLDMVWIDADHSHEGCSKDIDMWLPKVKKGGIICGHDYGVCSGVTTSVDNKFGDVDIIDTIWYKEVA
jgi:predicted O-methyltransferase YrrM